MARHCERFAEIDVTYARKSKSHDDFPPEAAERGATPKRTAKRHQIAKSKRKSTVLCADCTTAPLLRDEDSARDLFPSLALESAIADAITIAERIMARIDSRWQALAHREMQTHNQVSFPSILVSSSPEFISPLVVVPYRCVGAI